MIVNAEGADLICKVGINKNRNLCDLWSPCCDYDETIGAHGSCVAKP